MPRSLMRYRRSTTNSIRKRFSRHQTAVSIPIASVAFVQTDSIVIPSLDVGQFNRLCSAIRFQIAADQTTNAFAPANIGWALQYVPAGGSPQILSFNQTTSGDLAQSNQFILGAGIFQTNNAPNQFYARGHIMNDGDQIYLSVQPLTVDATSTLNALINYGIQTK